MAADYRQIAAAFEDTGLRLRGGFVLAAGEQTAGARSIVLIGNAGGEFWPAFVGGRREEADPLDGWTRRVTDPLAAQLGATAVYPNDQPYHPFQTWARRAEPVHFSPLGILIHPEFGLWHAYRAALLFPIEIDGVPAPGVAASPCDTCAEKPCLSACPVAAFEGKAYNVAVCTGHLRAGENPDCAGLGCRARNACPVAADRRYPPEQIRFHMAAFVKSRGGPWPRPKHAVSD